jgi:hypothetical protein
MTSTLLNNSSKTETRKTQMTRSHFFSMFSFLTALALIPTTPSLAQTSEFRTTPEGYEIGFTCDEYADKTLRQLQQAREMNCKGIAGPRWSANRQDHIGWCNSLRGNDEIHKPGVNNIMAGEDEARMAKLVECEVAEQVRPEGDAEEYDASAPSDPSMCIDANLGDPRGTDNKGFNVIMWKCHGGANQGARWIGGVGTKEKPNPLVFKVNGRFWCLTAGIKQPTGSGNKGFNAMVWPQCSGYNQKWYAENGMIKVNLKSKVYCLDVNESDKTGANGQGRNVIVWPECHGGRNQMWDFPVAK